MGGLLTDNENFECHASDRYLLRDFPPTFETLTLFASYGGEIHDAGKASGVGYESSTITFSTMPKSGLSFCMTKPTTSRQWRRKPYGRRLRQKRWLVQPQEKGEDLPLCKEESTNAHATKDESHRNKRPNKSFQAMLQAVEEMRLHREGKITLRTYKIEPSPLPVVDAELIRDTRERLKLSRRVFARQFVLMSAR